MYVCAICVCVYSSGKLPFNPALFLRLVRLSPCSPALGSLYLRSPGSQVRKGNEWEHVGSVDLWRTGGGEGEVNQIGPGIVT